ncbi:MAG TPA: hypothetical protein VK750_09890 [Cytophagaceae bacterium]|jgi:arsenate reductase|nr:hypothetical protein [Cytophagaceae bacterium]
MLFPNVKKYIEETVFSFDQIPAERKKLLANISQYVSTRLHEGHTAELIYICTHNSRRSHFGQIWGQVAAYYYGIEPVQTYSGGTEATAFNPNAIHAIERAGLIVKSDGAATNPKYTISFSDEGQTITCFSKTYNDDANPKSGFAAIMTCSDADENCPFVPGVAARIATTYEDPKAFDNTPKQDEMYDERCRQIARETLYAFSLIQSVR